MEHSLQRIDNFNINQQCYFLHHLKLEGLTYIDFLFRYKYFTSSSKRVHTSKTSRVNITSKQTL